MYKKIFRPILFLMSPEAIHCVIMWCLHVVRYIPGAKLLLRAIFTIRHPALEREVFGVKFPNPVGIAAGFDKNAEVYSELATLGFGYIEIGTVTPLSQPGNPKPRLFRLPDDQAIINRMGFNNQGMEDATANLGRKQNRRNYRKRVVLGGNIGKNTVTRNEEAPADYLKVFRSIYEYVDYFTVNVSCPNVANVTCLQNKENIDKILTPLMEFRRGQNDYCPILLKISPDLSFAEIDDIIDILKDTGLDGIVATNTTTSRTGLKTAAKTVKAMGNGGLSGSPLTARAIEVVRYVHEKTEGQFPIIGVGGIMSVDDAMAMLDAGASLIQIYSGFIYEGPRFVRKICKRIIARNSHAG